MGITLGHEQCVALANNGLISIGFEKNSEPFVEEMAKRIERWGFLNNEDTERECYLYMIEMEEKCGLEFDTDEEFINKNGDIAGFISIVRQDNHTALTKIPYTVDRETGKISTKLPKPLNYAVDVFNKMIKDMEEKNQRELKQHSKKKFFEHCDR